MNRGETSRYSQKQLNCDICYHHYDQSDRKPVLLCTQRHTICHYCVKNIIRDKKCPFCREKLNPSELVVNRTIYNEVGSKIVEPNVRLEVSHSLYSSSVQSSHVDFQGLQLDDEFNIQDQMLIEEWARVDTKKTRRLLYLFTLLLELPVFCSDLYLFISEPTQCMQTSLFGFGPTIKTWSIVISVIEFLHLLLFVFAFGIRVYRNQELYVNEWETRYGKISLYKIAVCTLVDTLYFFDIIISQCQGFVHLYGIILLSVHGIAALLGGIYLFKRN